MEKTREICKNLQVFSLITKVIYGNDYPTSNMYRNEVFKVKKLLIAKENDEKRLYFKNGWKYEREV